MAQRLKGQEVTLTVTGPNGRVTLDDIASLDTTIDLEILEEKYLGRTANDFDTIFNGVSGSLTAHLSSTDYIAFKNAIVDKAARRGGETIFSITTAYAFPDGSRVRVTHNDCHFGSIKESVGSRSDYVTFETDWKSGDYNIVS